MRWLPSAILALLLTWPAAADGRKPVVTVTVRGDHVEYDQEAGTLAVHGQVAITAQSDRPGVPTVSVASGEVEADLFHGLVIAHEGVRLLSQQLAMRGRRVEINLQRDEFRLYEGVLGVEAQHPDFPDLPVRGYFLGDEIKREADIVYVVEGRITTCDRAHPHYSVGVSQFTFDTRTSRWTVRKGRLSLYGHRVSIPGSYSAALKRGPSSDRQDLETPGFSSRDGLYLPVSWDLSRPESAWQATARIRLGTELRFPGEVRAVREEPRETLTLRATRREDVTWDIERRSELSRLPEIAYERRLLSPAGGDRALTLALSAAYLEERPPDSAEAASAKAAVVLDYSPQARARRAREGAWWAVSGSQSFYEAGERLRDLRLEVGLGSPRNRPLRGALWFVHHEVSGSTPFMFDDVFAENELYGQTIVPLGHGWSLDAFARLDTDETHLRELRVGVSRRLHCLTWGLAWDRASEGISVRVDVNGLTSGTAPYDSQPVVAADEVPPLPPMVPGPNGLSPLRLPGGDANGPPGS